MKGRSMSRRTRRAALLVTLGVFGFIVSCQVLVPGDVPTYTCTGSDPSSCPTGLICDPVSSTCVSPNSVTDGGPDDDRRKPDVVQDTGPKKSALGGTCVLDNDCESGLICGSTTILTSSITSSPVCTKTCCTSADCDTGFVCYASGTGGNYCVAATVADRTPPATGGKGPGESCTSGTECRSGLCDSSDAGQHYCVDTCCGDSQCGGGTVCKFTSIPGPGTASHAAWACAMGNEGGGDVTASCSDNPFCANNNCVIGVNPNKRCTPTCCSAKDCTLAGLVGNVCAYGGTGTDQLKWCFEPPSTGASEGAACVKNSDCTSRFCDAHTTKCARTCCQTKDCNANETCKPSPDGTPFLRCVAN
jgi:hypothetical protein